MKVQKYLYAVLVVSILSLIVSLSSLIAVVNIINDNRSNELSEINDNVQRINKTVVNPVYATDDAKNIDSGSSTYLRLVDLERLMYQICYGDAFYNSTHSTSFTSNKKCPAL